MAGPLKQMEELLCHIAAGFLTAGNSDVRVEVSRFLLLGKVFKNMKYMLSSMLVLMVLSVGSLGCSSESKSSRETTVKTPGGETTVTESKEVEKSGENPPAVK